MYPPTNAGKQKSPAYPPLVQMLQDSFPTAVRHVKKTHLARSESRALLMFTSLTYIETVIQG